VALRIEVSVASGTPTVPITPRIRSWYTIWWSVPFGIGSWYTESWPVHATHPVTADQVLINQDSPLIVYPMSRVSVSVYNIPLPGERHARTT
jgi:hypothetical protein